MSGYTPLFDTMLTGTLYGRWPHTGIWACLLSRASREGTIDETPAALAAAIGVPVETLQECIRDFMAPDPDSRSSEHEGRRMALIDERRTWGWKILNHGKYREKARKKNYDEKRTESGSDAERKRQERASRDVPTSPDESRAVPLSEAEAKALKKARKTRLPESFVLTAELSAYALDKLPDCDPTALFEQFTGQAKSKGWEYVDWVAAFQGYCRSARKDSGHWSAGQYPRAGRGARLVV